MKSELRVQVDACIAFLFGGSRHLSRQKAASYGDSRDPLAKSLMRISSVLTPLVFTAFCFKQTTEQR